MAAAKKRAENPPLPARLKALRKRLKITQAEAARRCHISWRTWAAYEGGARVPSEQTAYLIRLLETGHLPPE